jgi:hypothetical protein
MNIDPTCFFANAFSKAKLRNKFHTIPAHGIGAMLFKDEKIMLYHPGKCGGTTIEHLFLRILRNTNMATILSQPCFSAKNNKTLTTDCLSQRINFMVGYIAKNYAVNGVFRIYLQHADLQASIKIYGLGYIDSLFKITFVRNPFPRILSAFYYNMWDRKTTFRDFVLNKLADRYHLNKDYTVNHFGELNRFTHYDGQQYVNFVGKLENINADVERLSKQLGIPLDPSFERKHAKTVSGDIYEHYSEAYDAEMVDVVYNLYQKDFDYFDYTFKREMPFKPKDKRKSFEAVGNKKRPILKIYGERNSGTNYLTHLIRCNLDIELLPGVVQKKHMPAIDQKQLHDIARQRNLPEHEVVADISFQETFPINLGWKHALVKSADSLKKYDICSNNLSFLTLTKNPYSWLLSFYRRPYHHQYRGKKPDFETFLTSPWRTVGRENAPPEFSSPIDLWNQKNAAYLQLHQQFPTLNIRYEDLLSDPQGAMEAVSNIASCGWKLRPFVNVEHSTKRGSKDFSFYQRYYLEEQWKEQLSSRAIRIINERLNDEIVEAFRYKKLP